METNTPHVVYIKHINQAKDTYRKTVDKARATSTAKDTFDISVNAARCTLNASIDEAALAYLKS